jgi:hypothetical protein
MRAFIAEAARNKNLAWERYIRSSQYDKNKDMNDTLAILRDDPRYREAYKVYEKYYNQKKKKMGKDAISFAWDAMVEWAKKKGYNLP